MQLSDEALATPRQDQLATYVSRMCGKLVKVTIPMSSSVWPSLCPAVSDHPSVQQCLTVPVSSSVWPFLCPAVFGCPAVFDCPCVQQCLTVSVSSSVWLSTCPAVFDCSRVQQCLTTPVSSSVWPSPCPEVFDHPCVQQCLTTPLSSSVDHPCVHTAKEDQPRRRAAWLFLGALVMGMEMLVVWPYRECLQAERPGPSQGLSVLTQVSYHCVLTP